MKNLNLKCVVSGIMSVLLYASCSSNIKYIADAYWMHDVSQEVILTDDSLCFYLGTCALTLWTQRGDTVLPREDISRDEDDNTIKSRFITGSEFVDFNINNGPVRFDDKYPSVEKNKSKRRIYKENMKTLRNYKKGKGDFEFIVGNFRCWSFPGDSVCIFNSGKQYQQYRRINGITGDHLNILRTPIGYKFRYRMYQRALSETGDTLPPFWCRGQLPPGIKKVIMPQQTEFIIDYGEGQLLWINIVPNKVAKANFHPINISLTEAKEYVESRFPTYHRFFDLHGLKSQFLAGLNLGCVLKRTNKCTIIASGIKQENMPMFEALLTKCFVEADPMLTATFYNFWRSGANDYPIDKESLDQMDEFFRDTDILIWFRRDLYKP